MFEESEMGEFVEEAVEDIRAFIDTEKQIVQEEHELMSKLGTMDLIIGHIVDRIPENMTHLLELTGKISDKIVLMDEQIETWKLHKIRIMKEEKNILSQLEDDVKHREWKAVRKDLDLETEVEEQSLRLEKKELKYFHSLFIDLMKLMKRSNLISVTEEDLTFAQEKEKYVKLEEYYFLQFYKFVRAYERIFRHLWKKELILSRKIKRDSKRID